MSVFIWVVLALISGLVGAEIVGWCAPLQRFLIRRAAVVLPNQERARYTEEWYAELEELPQAPITRLLWVSSLVLKRGALARALGVPKSKTAVPRVVERGFDILGAAVGVLLLAPLLLSIVVLVALNGGGPVFRRRIRVRPDGSMYVGLFFRTWEEAADVESATSSAEPLMNGGLKVHGLGLFLLKTSLDDLPQLFSVLSGDMSLRDLWRRRR